MSASLFNKKEQIIFQQTLLLGSCHTPCKIGGTTTCNSQDLRLKHAHKMKELRCFLGSCSVLQSYFSNFRASCNGLEQESIVSQGNTFQDFHLSRGSHHLDVKREAYHPFYVDDSTGMRHLKAKQRRLWSCSVAAPRQH